MTPNCASTPTAVFFPRFEFGNSRRKYQQAVRRAQTICNGCPNQLPCYALAVRNHETTGIWGGINFASKHHKTPQPNTGERTA